MNRKRNNIEKEFSTKEIAESLVISQPLRADEKQKAASDLGAARKKIQGSLSDNDHLTARLLQFKLQMEEYLTQEDFQQEMTFGNSLKNYIAILNKQKKVFAKEIDINEVELSQLINRHRTPPEYIIIRLEIHSNNAIPADRWYRLVEREKVHALKINKAIRKSEREHVRHKLNINLL